MVDSNADMDRDTSVNPEEILSEQELESLRLAQELYSIRAKQAAANLANVLELPVEVRNQIIGALTLRLASLDFEQRREIAIKFSEISLIFDGITAAAEPVSLDLISTEPEIDPGLYDGAEPSLSPLPNEADANDTNDDSGEDDTDDASNLEVSNSGLNLGNTQLTWLARIYGVETAKKIGAMPKDEFNEFLTNLSEHYLSLRIRRLTPRVKIVRVEQLKLLMDNKEYKEIALQFNANPYTTTSGLRVMAEGIARTASAEELLALIPGLAESDETEQEIELLRYDQERWFIRLMDSNQWLDIINMMNSQQRTVLEEKLAEKLHEALINKNGEYITNIRVAGTRDYLRGTPVEEIAQQRGVTDETIRSELYQAADRLKDTIPPNDLIKFVLEARDYKPTQNQ
jgi:hypothetical protein